MVFPGFEVKNNIRKIGKEVKKIQGTLYKISRDVSLKKSAHMEAAQLKRLKIVSGVKRGVADKDFPALLISILDKSLLFL